MYIHTRRKRSQIQASTQTLLALYALYTQPNTSTLSSTAHARACARAMLYCCESSLTRAFSIRMPLLLYTHTAHDACRRMNARTHYAHAAVAVASVAIIMWLKTRARASAYACPARSDDRFTSRAHRATSSLGPAVYSGQTYARARARSFVRMCRRRRRPNASTHSKLCCRIIFRVCACVCLCSRVFASKVFNPAR